MITGIVNASLEATIPLEVIDSAGRSHRIEAIIDTGYTGALTLPPSLIAALGLLWRSQATATLANGAVITCDVYAGVAIWNGQARLVLIESSDSEPLVGMDLLKGFELSVQVVAGGAVTIEPLP